MFCCVPCLNLKGPLEAMMETMPPPRRCQLDQLIQTSGSRLDLPPEVTDDMAEQNRRLKKNSNHQQQQRRRKAVGNRGGGHQDGDVVERPGHEGRPEKDKGAVWEPKEEEERWVAEVDRGVLITFTSLAGGGNAIVKIRFRKDMFDVAEAQKWWVDNGERILSLYSVRKRDASAVESDDDEMPGGASVDQESSSRTQTTNTSDYSSAVSSSSRHADHRQTSVGGGQETVAVTGRLVEWVIEDPPGVFITVRSLSDGTKQIRRVELSREKFGEVKGRVWWEENKARLHRQYT